MIDANEQRRLLVCFDFEGSYGMPYEVPFDVHRSARVILDELAQHGVRAVFFVVGRMVEDHPDVVADIARAGHEIGLHGYEHDDLSAYDAEALAVLDKNLARVGSLLDDITGSRPRGFRAPYLLAPHFYRAEVYAMLRAQGFSWVSNREVRYPVELLRPGLFPVRSAWRAADGSARLVSDRVLLGPLNAGLVAKETFGGSPTGRLRWLLGQRPPFSRDGLIEVPVYSPLDCDLLGLPRPTEETSPEALEYARAVIHAAAAVSPGQLSMITFHDWIVSGGNRMTLLGEALTAAHACGSEVATIAERPEWLTIRGLPDRGPSQVLKSLPPSHDGVELATSARQRVPRSTPAGGRCRGQYQGSRSGNGLAVL
jgi:peptidoglycan/xylan/chitin deacetylase (PgdA/CDA1 family)